MSVFETISKLMHGSTDQLALTEHDVIYNRVARDQPAYISLLYPLLIVIVYAYNKKWLFHDNDSVVLYIFNTVLAFSIFVPALFFLYKQVIRDISILFVEKIFFFFVTSPEVAVTLRNTPGNFSGKSHSWLRNKINALQPGTIPDERICFWSRKHTGRIKCIYSQIKEDKEIREDNIVFENNMVYGFYRNLCGGIILDIAISYILPSIPVISKDVSVTGVRPALWLALGLMLILAWNARRKHAKRQYLLYFREEKRNL